MPELDTGFGKIIIPGQCILCLSKWQFMSCTSCKLVNSIRSEANLYVDEKLRPMLEEE